MKVIPKRFRRSLLTVSLVAALLAAGVAALETRRQELTEAPEMAYSTAEYLPPMSTITAPVEISLNSLTRALNSKVPAGYAHEWKDSVRLEETVRVPYPCVYHWRPRICQREQRISGPSIPYHGDARITRPGPIELVGHGDELEVRLPLAFWVRISGRGALGSKVHETAEGSFVLSTRVRATAREDWTLAFAAAPTIEWQGAAGGKLFNLVPYTIRSLVEDKLNDGMQDLVAELEEEANKELALRDSARRAWNAAFVVRRIPGELPSWAVVTPHDVAWSPLLFAEGSISSALRLSSQMAVSLGDAAPATPKPTPLPVLATFNPPVKGEVLMNAPLRVSYENLSSFALNMAKMTPSLRESGVEIKGIEFYPAGKRLAVRVYAKVDVPGQWLDTRVVMHLAGTPEIDPTTGVLSLRGLSLNRAFDNPIVDVLEVPLHDLVERALSEKLKADTGPIVDDTNRRIADALMQLTEKGAALTAHIESVGLGAAHLMESAVVVPVQIKGSVGAKIDLDSLAQR